MYKGHKGVNISTKSFSPLIYIVFVCSESCFYTFGHWVGWRLARGEDGRGWPIRVPQDFPISAKCGITLWNKRQMCEIRFSVLFYPTDL